MENLFLAILAVFALWALLWLAITFPFFALLLLFWGAIAWARAEST